MIADWSRRSVYFGLVAICGCGTSMEKASSEYMNQAPPAQAAGQPAEAPAAKVGEAGDAAARNEAALPRRIIFTADVQLIVEDFEGLPEKVAELVERYGGFVAHSQVQGSAGSPRAATWKIRVPVEKYEDLLEAARRLGEVQSVSSDSQDVTAEYYDLEARIHNKQVEEKRLLTHLTDSTGKLEDILAVERELSRVREELEQMQGRLRLLKDLVTLTTVTLHVREIKGFVPLQAPTLGVRISRAFAGSLRALSSTGESLLIAAVVVGPWLVLPALVLSAILLTRRRRPITPK